MKLTIDLGTCTVIVQFNERPGWCYAVFISKLTGQTIRLTIPELIEALERAAR